MEEQGKQDEVCIQRDVFYYEWRDWLHVLRREQ